MNALSWKKTLFMGVAFGVPMTAYFIWSYGIAIGLFCGPLSAVVFALLMRWRLNKMAGTRG